MQDGTASVPTSIGLTIAAVNDAPALTGTRATLASGTEDTPYVINLADLVVGWTDADGDRLNSNNWYVDHGWVSYGYDGNGNAVTVNFPKQLQRHVTLNYHVQDGTASVPTPIGLTIAAVNDALRL